MTQSRILRLTLLVLLTPTWCLWAQESRQGAYSDILNVDVVNVDVVATDRGGEPLRGLTVKDFQVSVDKKKVKLTNFYAADGQGASQERLSVIVYIDNFNLRQGNRGPTLEALQGFLAEQVKAGHEAMVVSYDSGIRVRQELTDDVAALEAALSQLGGETGQASVSESLLRSTSDSVEDTLRLMGGNSRDQRLGTAALDGLLAQLRGYAEAVRQDVTTSVESLITFTNALAGIPGRKAVYYVSDGLPMRPLDRLMATIQTRLRGGGSFGDDQGAGSVTDFGPEAGAGTEGAANPSALSSDQIQPDRSTDMDVSRLVQVVEPFDTSARFQELTALANSNRVTFYTVKAPPGDASGANLVDTAKGSDAGRLSDLRESLELMASATGGLSFTSGTDVDRFLQESRGDFASYYSLGFEPRDKDTNAYHAIALKMKGKGRVRYRQGYIRKPFLTRLADRTVGALILGFEENLHGVEMEVDSEDRAEDGNYNVSVIVTFPIGKISLVESNGVHRASAKVAVALLTSQGHVAPVQHMEVPLQIPESDLATAREQLFGARVNLRMPEGEQKLAIGLWDENVSQGSFVSRELVVGTQQ